MNLEISTVYEISPVDTFKELMTSEFSALIEETGDLETADYVDVTLIIDGNPILIPNWLSMGSATHTLIGDNPAPSDWISTTVNSTGISGSTLQIEICMFHGSELENMFLDDVTLTGTTLAGANLFKFYDADPATGTANLLAGPAASYDPMTTSANSPQSIWVVGDFS